MEEIRRACCRDTGKPQRLRGTQSDKHDFASAQILHAGGDNTLLSLLYIFGCDIRRGVMRDISSLRRLDKRFSGTRDVTPISGCNATADLHNISSSTIFYIIDAYYYAMPEYNTFQHSHIYFVPCRKIFTA